MLYVMLKLLGERPPPDVTSRVERLDLATFLKAAFDLQNRCLKHILEGKGEIEETKPSLEKPDENEGVKVEDLLFMVDTMLEEAENKESPDMPNFQTLGAIVSHFQKLFDVQSLKEVYPQMNKGYTRLGEKNNVVRDLQELLKLDSQSSLCVVVSTVGKLCKMINEDVNEQCGPQTGTVQLQRSHNCGEHFLGDKGEKEEGQMHQGKNVYKGTEFGISGSILGNPTKPVYEHRKPRKLPSRGKTEVEKWCFKTIALTVKTRGALGRTESEGAPPSSTSISHFRVSSIMKLTVSLLDPLRQSLGIRAFQNQCLLYNSERLKRGQKYQKSQQNRLKGAAEIFSSELLASSHIAPQLSTASCFFLFQGYPLILGYSKLPYSSSYQKLFFFYTSHVKEEAKETTQSEEHQEINQLKEIKKGMQATYQQATCLGTG
ncbi:hypothetical protein ACRRTK_012238 [Alexandromys fortis]